MTILFPRLKRKAIGWCEATIGADKGEQIALALEALAGKAAPAGECDGRFCPDCAWRAGLREAAAVARQHGGVAPVLPGVPKRENDHPEPGNNRPEVGL